jgi:hypothetical protein
VQNQCRPSGSEALPRGIVQDKSNLELETLGGNPERKRDVRSPKSLLAIPVGIKQKVVVDKLVKKVTFVLFSASRHVPCETPPNKVITLTVLCCPCSSPRPTSR